MRQVGTGRLEAIARLLARVEVQRKIVFVEASVERAVLMKAAAAGPIRERLVGGCHRPCRQTLEGPWEVGYLRPGRPLECPFLFFVAQGVASPVVSFLLPASSSLPRSWPGANYA